MCNKIIALLFVVFTSCSLKCDSKIHVDELILEYAKENNFPYCKYVNNCLEGEPSSIKKMFCENLVFFDGESAYMHAFNVYKITKFLGENRVVGIMKEFSKNELKIYFNNLQVGLEYESLKNKNVKETFPKIYSMIMSQTIGN
jgi:hypothetical protein